MQGPSVKGTIISPKTEHHTVRFKNAALTSGPNRETNFLSGYGNLGDSERGWAGLSSGTEMR